MREQRSINVKVLPLIHIPSRPPLLIPTTTLQQQQAKQTKTPTAKKLPPIIFTKTALHHQQQSKSQPQQLQTLRQQNHNQIQDEIQPPESVQPQTRGYIDVDVCKRSVSEPLTPISSFSSNNVSSGNNDINSLMRSLFFQLRFAYVTVYSISDLPSGSSKASADGDRRLLYLIQIYQQKSTTIDEKLQIAKFVMQFVVRELPRYEHPNIYSEVGSPIYTITNSILFEKVHELFQMTLRDRIAPIGRKFLFNLVSQLDTTVESERLEVEKELLLILKEYCVAKPYILKYFLAKLTNILTFHFSPYLKNFESTQIFEGINLPPFSVAPILRIFVYYFNNLIKTPAKKAFVTFQTVFFPMFTNSNITMFEKAIRDLTRFFLSRDKSLAAWCLYYLCKHWPKMSPRKELCFLQELESILSFIDEPKELAMAAPIVSKTFASCIASESVNVALSALLLLSGNQILSNFEEVHKPLFLGDIMPALKKTSGHWKPQIREMAEELLGHLMVVQKNTAAFENVASNSNGGKNVVCFDNSINMCVCNNVCSICECVGGDECNDRNRVEKWNRIKIIAQKSD